MYWIHRTMRDCIILILCIRMLIWAYCVDRSNVVDFCRRWPLITLWGMFNYLLQVGPWIACGGSVLEIRVMGFNFYSNDRPRVRLGIRACLEWA